MSNRCLRSCVLLALLLPSVTLFAKTRFDSAWRAPDAGQVAFAGRKVAALVIDKDESLRMSAEEALSRELTTRGMQGVAAYRLVPKEELRSADKARGWFERAQVDGVVVMRVVDDKIRRTYQPSTWSAPYYSSLWGYYGYGWGAVYDPGYVRSDRILSLETLIYSVPRNALLWAGVSSTENPRSTGQVVGEVVKEAVKEMQKQGFVSR